MIFFLICFSPVFIIHVIAQITVTVDLSEPIHEVDPEFLSVAIDWAKIMGFTEHGRWHTKIDLKNAYLVNLLRQLGEIQPLHLRLGGGAGECIYYLNETMEKYLSQYCRSKGTRGVISEEYFVEILEFCEKTGVDLIWGLNAAYKRGFIMWYHPWNPKNAEDLIKYLIANGKERLVFAWELGNEPNNEKFGYLIKGKDYANDFRILHDSISSLYAESKFRPLLLGPDTCQSSHVSAEWIETFKKNSESFISGYTYHFYLNGDKSITDVLNTTLLIEGTEKESNKWETSKSLTIWLGEGTVKSQGGVPGISDAFASSLWFAGELGVLASIGNKVYIRQEFVGGDYGMLNYTDYTPLPDFFLAVMWKRVMGTKVYKTKSSDREKVLAFVHSPHTPRFNFSVVVINFSEDPQLVDLVDFTNVTQEQYHLTAESLHDHVVKVNGAVAKVGKDPPYNLPSFDPVVKEGSLIEVKGYSIVFSNIKLKNY